MKQAVFLGPEKQPRIADRRGGIFAGLPPDLEEEAVRRIGWFALASASAEFLFLILCEIFPWLRLGPRSFVYAVELPLVVFSLTLFFVAHRGLLPQRRIVALSFVYKIFGAAALSLIANAQRWPTELPLPGWSPVAIWVLFFPILVPSTTLSTLITSTIAVGMEPACVWLLVRLRYIDMPAQDVLIRRFLPSVIALGLSVFVSRTVFGLGRKLDAARELGSYKLVERLGSGGMGEVWRAQHRMLARPAAIKLIRPAAFQIESSSPHVSNARRFEHEAQSTAALRSPHTIGIFDFGIARDGAFYYVMELLDGMDFDTLVKLDGPQSPARIVYLLRQACHSLHEAHKAGMVHRDIKPANLFLCRYGADLDFVKVLDFGLVTERTGDEPSGTSRLTNPNAVAGTPAFMAPEMIVGDRPVDGRTDIYALGCVAYWLLTGHLVFEGDNPMQIMVNHATEQPVPPSKRIEEPIPQELERIVLECLEKEPERRPQSAHELSDRLAAVELPRAWTEQDAEGWWDSMPRASRREPVGEENDDAFS